MAVLEEHDNSCFCVMRQITRMALFTMMFRFEMYCLDIFCCCLFHISGLVCQDVLLLFITIVTFVSISTDNTVQLRHIPPKEVLYNILINILIILPSNNQLNGFLFKLLVWRYFKEFLYVFLCFFIPLDNNIWYARVRIFNCRTKYTSSNVRYCYDVNFFMNILNKIKSQLKLSLPFLIFCLGVTVLFLFIYILLIICFYQKRFYCYIFEK